MNENLPASTASLMPSMQEWTIIKEQASLLVKTGFLPKGIDTPEKAIAIALKGREMGIPMMQAYSHIAIVQGKPCISAELMLAQIRKNVPGAKIDIKGSDDSCLVRTKRPGEGWQEFSFTMEDARKAGLIAKGGSWSSYPDVMLQWRAVSKMARAVYPDAIMGCSYTPEEMGADVNDEGEIIDVKQSNQTTLPPGPPPPGPATFFDAKDRADIDWLKAHPELALFDEIDKKKVAIELHGKPRSEITLAARRVEDAHIKSAQNVVDATPVQ